MMDGYRLSSDLRGRSVSWDLVYVSISMVKGSGGGGKRWLPSDIS